MAILTAPAQRAWVASRFRHRSPMLIYRRLPMKTLILALMLTLTAVSGVAVASQSAFAGGPAGSGGD